MDTVVATTYTVDFTLLPSTIEETLKLHEPLILKVIRSLYPVIRSAKLDKEEVFQVACIGMWKAYKSYDSTKKSRWITWAWIIIRQEIIELAKDNRTGYKIPRHAYKNKERVQNMPKVVNRDISDLYCLENQFAIEDDNNLTALVEREDLSRATTYLDMVDPKYRRLLYLKFFKGLNYREISKILNLSHESLRQHCRRALHQLRQDLGETDEPRDRPR